MRALAWHGKHDVRVDTVDDPEIVNPRDCIIKVTATAICGSDLHLYDGYIPTMQAGDILGHEFMGEVVEVGAKSTLKKGQKVVVPFTIACGSCYHCGKHQYSACDNGLPADNQDIAQELYGQPMSGLFGYSHMTGGYAGGQAEYVRVPFSDVGPIVIPDGVDDEKVLFLSDILPTGWMAAENAQIEPGDTVAVWGCGPVGLFAVQSAFLMGAERVIAIDHFPHRLELAKKFGAETINYEESAVYEALMVMTGGIGPDAVIDSVGLEAHGFFVDNVLDQIKASTFLGTDRAHSIRQAIIACRKGGRVSMPAVYGGFTGASTGIGFELATLAAKDGYDILVVANEALIQSAAADFKQFGTDVIAVEADLSTIDGVDALLSATNGRKVDVLCANAGHGLGHGFLDQALADWRNVVDTNITGTLYLVQKVLPAMVARNDGKVLVTGSVAGYIPGAFQAVYNGSKAFIDSFTEALRNEIKEADGVTLTTLMPGPVDTEFFDRADMNDTSVGTDPNKRDAADVAKDGWDALMSGKASVFSGLMTKVQGVLANVIPGSVLAEQHRKMAEPGSAKS